MTTPLFFTAEQAETLKKEIEALTKERNEALMAVVRLREALKMVKEDKGYPMRDETFEAVDKALSSPNPLKEKLGKVKAVLACQCRDGLHDQIDIGNHGITENFCITCRDEVLSILKGLVW